MSHPRGEHFRFALKARDSLRVGNEKLRQDFDGDFPIELRVAGAIHLTHPAGAEGGEDLERPKPGAGGEGQQVRWIIRARADPDEHAGSARRPGARTDCQSFEILRMLPADGLTR